MKPVVRLSAVVSLAFFMVVLSCRKEGEAKNTQIAQVSQDTMLMHDLAEANKNTAAASAVDNSLNTVKTNPDGSTALVSDASLNGSNGNRAQQSETETSPATPTNQPRLTVPAQANDAHPTTLPVSRSPANSVSTRSTGDPCDSPTTTDQRYCLNRSIVANDADLNRTYQDLLAQARKSGGGDLEERFRQSQRDWVNQRDVECRSRNPVEGGKLWARSLGRCLADYSDRRAAELRRSLTSLRGQ